MNVPLISIVIRTLNEERYLEELLSAVSRQICPGLSYEVVVIDSGSTDRTLEIANKYSARITHIKKEEFSFGRSLNMGSHFADGEYLVYVSGHCIPVDDDWIKKLVDPLLKGVAGYSYGGQLGRDTTKFSENELFKKYFPATDEIPQAGFFCNNANSAITRKVWADYLFDENVTGLEDMELAKRYVADGGRIAYVSSASVFHIHDESWSQTKRRYERESVALNFVMPEVRITFFDLSRYIVTAIFADAKAALAQKSFARNILPIVAFRTAQYFGSFRGNNLSKQTANRRKEEYFYPREKFRG